MMMKHTFILFILLMINPAHGLVCPEKTNIPLCPESGSTLLDDTYPVQAFVISNKPQIDSIDSAQTPVLFVEKIIENYDFKNIPQIILPMSKTEDYEKIVEKMKQNLAAKNIPAVEIEKIVKQITYVPMTSKTWHQDWFESFVDLKTGSPVIRQIEGYEAEPVSSKGDEVLAKSGESCLMSKGDKLKSDYQNGTSDTSFEAGEMGGNIEGAPGGFCLTGDNQSTKFSSQFCGNKDNIIQLQTSWLTVGHVDEIFKIIPTQFNDGRPKECEFSVMAASPKKGIELLKMPTSKNSSFLRVKAPRSVGNDLRYSRVENVSLCTYVRDLYLKNQNQAIPKGTRSVFLKLLFGSSAFASTRLINMSSEAELEKIRSICLENIENVTNFEMQEIMQLDKNFVSLNNAIEESIKNDKALIKSKILSRLPQCRKYYNELDVPNIFYGDIPITDPATGKPILAKPGGASSYLPNPTNSVVMNKTIVFSDTGNSVFNTYLKEQMVKRKMKADFIDTWDYAHVGDGNLHCSSHSISHCRPKK